MTSLSGQLAAAAHELAAALAGVPGAPARPGSDASASLPWDEQTQARATLALHNGGTRDAPAPRRGITDWSEQTNQTRWMFDRMRFACLTPLANGKRNRRGEKYLSRWAVIVHRFDPALSRELLKSIKGPTYLDRAERHIREYGDLSVEQMCPWPHFR